MFTGDSPIFQQLAAKIADDIVSGSYPEETAVPSATDFALFYQMNPATASKGVNVLVEIGALYKRRGIGMFVATGARELLRTRRRDEFRRQYIEPLLIEAGVLEIGRAELHELLDAPAGSVGPTVATPVHSPDSVGASSVGRGPIETTQKEPT